MNKRRGVPESESRKVRLAVAAARMRAYYLTHGKGCRTRAKVIAARTEGA